MEGRGMAEGKGGLGEERDENRRIGGGWRERKG